MKYLTSHRRRISQLFLRQKHIGAIERKNHHDEYKKRRPQNSAQSNPRLEGDSLPSPEKLSP
jgi:hypothetical protein